MTAPKSDRAALRPPAYRPLPSNDPSMVWPGHLSAVGNEKLAVLQQLEASQWLTPQQLLALQLRQASILLTHCTLQVPFYRERLSRAGFQPDRPIARSTWYSLPVLTRAALQAAGEALYAQKLPSGHGKINELTTGGSTGRPITARGTEVVQLFWDALTLREHLWHHRDFSAKLAAIRSFPAGMADYPDGAKSAYWHSSVAETFGPGPAVGLYIAAKVDEQVAWLQREQPTYLLTYPSALRELLVHCRANGIGMPGLRQVRTISEPLSEEVRQLCRDVWGVDIADTYSAQETGYLAIQCPEEGSYHVQSETVLLEVLGAGGKPCAPGEIGEVVVTPLHNFAMPMLRYAVGDLAEMGPPCPCGRGLPVLKRILGRTRDMLVYPDGRKAWAQLGTSKFTRFAGLRQYQVVQHAVDDLEIKLVADAALSPVEEAELREVVQARAGHAFPIRITYHDEIPRSASGKFQEFISLLS